MNGMKILKYIIVLIALFALAACGDGVSGATCVWDSSSWDNCTWGP